MKNIAIVSAHIDDELLSCSGIITKTRPENLILIYTSKSDYIDLDGTVYRTIEQAQTERLSSLQELCKYLPIIIDLNYETKHVLYNSEAIEKVDTIFRKYQIDTVFTHSPSDTHSDHSNTGRIAFTASRRIPNLFTFEPIFPAQLSTIFQPNIYIDISEIYDKKIKALKLQKSQYTRYGQKWLDSIDALSKLRGIECMVDRAECFTVIKYKMEL